MVKECVLETRDARIVIMDSISYLEDSDAGSVVISASHGGFSAGEYVLKMSPPKAVVFNDAGVGKDGAGIVALSMLNDKGIIAATVSHNTARIGDARDTWENGVISHVNPVASSRGIRAGIRVVEFCNKVFSASVTNGHT